MSRSNAIDALEASLHRRFRVVETSVPIAGRTVAIIHPASAEDLIDESDFERDERLPYWAELWPSAAILGAKLIGMTGAGRRLLELGCGAGLVATCAALAGFRVTASDYYEDALRFARVNSVRNGAPEPDTMLLDWRHLPPDPPRFDVVAASDVLYERPYGRVVAQAVAATLAPGGRAFIADPGRVGRDELIRSLGQAGLDILDRAEVPFEDGAIKQRITVLEIAWRN